MLHVPRKHIGWISVFFSLWFPISLLADNPSPFNSFDTLKKSTTNKNTMLPLVSPQEFQTNVAKRNMETLKKSADNYKNLNQELNPGTSTLPSPNMPQSPVSPTEFKTDNIRPTNQPAEAPISEENSPEEETPSSSYYFQTKQDQNKETTPKNQTGFNPYGTGNN